MEFHKKEGLLAGAQKAKVQSISWPGHVIAMTYPCLLVLGSTGDLRVKVSVGSTHLLGLCEEGARGSPRYT